MPHACGHSPQPLPQSASCPAARGAGPGATRRAWASEYQNPGEMGGGGSSSCATAAFSASMLVVLAGGLCGGVSGET